MLYWTARGSVPRSLGHRNKDEAVAWAHERAAALRRNRKALAGDPPTVRRVLTAYLDYLERRVPREVRDARRCDELWVRFLGPDLDLERELDEAKLALFVELRRSGE